MNNLSLKKANKNNRLGGRLVKLSGRVVSLAPAGSAALVSLMVFGTAADADNECGASAPTVTCSSGVFSEGVIYKGVTQLVIDGTDIIVSGTGIESTSGSQPTTSTSIHALNFDSISTTSAGQNGLFAHTEADGSPQVNHSANIIIGSIRLNGTGGEIITESDGSNGAYALSTGTSSVEVSIQLGSVKTRGSASHGLFAEIDNTRSAGIGFASAHQNGGVINTSGGGSHAAYVISNAIGSSQSSFGALAQQTSGSINTVGMSSHGLFSEVTSTESIAIAATRIAGGVLQTEGDKSHALYALTAGQGEAFINISNTSSESTTISTTGNGSFAALAQTDNATSDANIRINIFGGTLTTDGIGSHALYGLSNGLGDVSIDRISTRNFSGGDIVTTGANADGYRAEITNAVSTRTAGILLSGEGSIRTEGEGSHGAHTISAGLGHVSIAHSTGTVETSGTGSHGLFAEALNSSNAKDVAIKIGGVASIKTTGNESHAIMTSTQGSGKIDVDIGGDANVFANGINSNAVQVETELANATYDVRIRENSKVRGGTGEGAGIKIDSQQGNTGSISIEKGTTIDGSTGIIDAAGSTLIFNNGSLLSGLSAGAGNDLLGLATGSVTTGNLGMGDGSDSIIINAGADISSVTLIDGGDDIGTLDGFEDSLSFLGYSGSVFGASIQNWERILIGSGSTISFSDNMLTAGNLQIGKGGVLEANTGALKIDGDLRNTGTLTMADGLADDSVVVTGDYTGSAMGEGTMLMDVDFANDITDTLRIEGDYTKGSTSITLNDVTIGFATGTDLLLVDVTGTADEADFTLTNGPIVSGAFTYGLELQGSQFFLASNLNETGAAYSNLPSALDIYKRFPTLEQRVGERKITADQPMWIKTLGERSKTDLTAGSSSGKYWGLQFGADVGVHAKEDGDWVFGLLGQFGKLQSEIVTGVGSGALSAQEYGIGATATWYGHNGTYFDAQGQVNWSDSDVSSSLDGNLANDVSTTSYAFGVEIGHRIELNSSVTLVPQIQAIFGRSDQHSFVDQNGNDVSIGKSRNGLLRLGLAYEYEWDEQNKIYAIGNWSRDLSHESTISVAGDAFTISQRYKNWLEIGFGGTMKIDEGIGLYAETSYRTAMGNSVRADNNVIQASIGMTFEW